jgi:uncharacterized protein
MDIIDRRENPKGKSLGNRQRFIRRARGEIREAIKSNLRKRSVSDATSGEDVSISADGIREPHFVHDSDTGEHGWVLPGNKEYRQGDRIAKPAGGAAGGGGRASPDGSGEDDFTFALTRDEFLDLFFEDLDLPDLVKQKIKAEEALKPQRAGFSITGSPNRLNLVRTVRRSLQRRIALGRPSDQLVAELEDELAALKAGTSEPAAGSTRASRIAELEEALARALRKRGRVPYIDPVDLRYNRYEMVPKPVSQAVMFCLMDVSASMDEAMKDLAKRFFMLLHLFLDRRYDHVDVVFIRHTSTAAEVDEETFFYGRETGGTVVSTAFDEMLKIVSARYAVSDWNIYVAQASDGDDVPTDVAHCVALLNERVLPMCQHMAYVEISPDARRQPGLYGRGGSVLWSGYEEVARAWPSFAMRMIGGSRDIYPVFRGLFSREGLAA